MMVRDSFDCRQYAISSDWSPTMSELKHLDKLIKMMYGISLHDNKKKCYCANQTIIRPS